MDILFDFDYKRDDYETIKQGFLDENDNFYDRREAWKHAYVNRQIHPNAIEHTTPELYSEDLW